MAITTEFLLAASEVYSPMASVETFGANTARGPHEYKLPLMEEGKCTFNQISVFSSCPGTTFRDN